MDDLKPEQLYSVAKDLLRAARALDVARKRNPLPPPPVTAAWVRAILQARRAREMAFESGLFADPAWDMLLDLYAAWLDETDVSVTSLCIAAYVPPTTALRWINVLEARGLVHKEPAKLDGRRVLVRLTDHAAAAMERTVLAAAPLAGRVL